MAHDAGTDPRALRTGAYADASGLGDRQAIYAHADAPADFVEWVRARVDWPETGRVLDVGCGPGALLERVGERAPGLQRVALDASVGMVRVALDRAAGSCPVVAEATALPHVSGAFRVVIAAHMLYHVPQPEHAIAEMRRVLGPEGVLVAATNGREHLAELRALVTDAVGADAWLPVSDRWDLETGERMLTDVFDRVDVHHFGQRLRIPDSEPVVRYLASLSDMVDPRLTRDGTWSDVLEHARNVVDAEIARGGEFVVVGRSGVLVAT